MNIVIAIYELENSIDDGELCFNGQNHNFDYVLTCSLDIAPTANPFRWRTRYDCRVINTNDDTAPPLWQKSHQEPYNLEDEEGPLTNHDKLRAFLLDCCVDLFMVGVRVFGRYEFEGQQFTVEEIEPPAIALPDGLVDL